MVHLKIGRRGYDTHTRQIVVLVDDPNLIRISISTFPHLDLVSAGQAALCEIKTFAMIGPSDALISGNAKSLVDIASIASVYLHPISVGGIAVSHVYDDIRERKFD